ncbi:hypothetical protein TNCV_4017591 [Trichonephila clavipes]|nr:hypothetical protein TNCV_4017591 [Trichonephila clavipes]
MTRRLGKGGVNEEYNRKSSKAQKASLDIMRIYFAMDWDIYLRRLPTCVSHPENKEKIADRNYFLLHIIARIKAWVDVFFGLISEKHHHTGRPTGDITSMNISLIDGFDKPGTTTCHLPNGHPEVLT